MHCPAMRTVDDRTEYVPIPEFYADRGWFLLRGDYGVSSGCNHLVFPVCADSVILFSSSDVAGSDQREGGNCQTLFVS